LGRADFSALLRNEAKCKTTATAGSFDKLKTGSSTAQFAKGANCSAQDDSLLVVRGKQMWGLCNGKGVAVKLERWQAFLLTRSASATAVRTAGAANSLLSIWIFDAGRFFRGWSFDDGPITSRL
jgi:hypothetical protein